MDKNNEIDGWFSSIIITSASIYLILSKHEIICKLILKITSISKPIKETWKSKYTKLQDPYIA